MEWLHRSTKDASSYFVVVYQEEEEDKEEEEGYFRLQVIICEHGFVYQI